MGTQSYKDNNKKRGTTPKIHTLLHTPTPTIVKEEIRIKSTGNLL